MVKTDRKVRKWSELIGSQADSEKACCYAREDQNVSATVALDGDAAAGSAREPAPGKIGAVCTIAEI